MREAIVWILFCLMLALASFGWGYICGGRQTDEMRKDVSRLKQDVRYLLGERAAEEARRRR